jgi:predicted transcriptional regulator
MKTAIIEINPDWKAALKAGAKGIRQAARSGRLQQFTFSYASPELLFSEISPKRWGVLEAMSGAGEMSLRELARRLERDVKSVHRDVHALLETGLLEKTESGKIVCPFDKVRVDFTLVAARRIVMAKRPVTWKQGSKKTQEAETGRGAGGFVHPPAKVGQADQGPALIFCWKPNKRHRRGGVCTSAIPSGPA